MCAVTVATATAAATTATANVAAVIAVTRLFVCSLVIVCLNNFLWIISVFNLLLSQISNEISILCDIEGITASISFIDIQRKKNFQKAVHLNT